MAIVSIGLGSICCALALNILMSFGEPDFIVYDPGPTGVQCFLLLVIITAYSVLLFLLYRNKQNYVLVMTALSAFLLSFVATPVIIVYSVDISNFFMKFG